MDFSTGVGQGSSLSPILTGLYVAPAIFKVAPLQKTLKLRFVKAEVLTKPEAYCYRHTARLGLDSMFRLENTGGEFWGIILLQRVVYILLETPNLRHDIA